MTRRRANFISYALATLAAALIFFTCQVFAADVTLSGEGSLLGALDAAGPYGSITVDAAETLAAGTYTVPEGVELRPGGGSIAVPPGSSLHVYGPVAGHSQVFSAAGGIIRVTGPLLDCAWFGMRRDTHPLGYNVEVNALALEACQAASANASTTHPGARLRLPPGRVRVNSLSTVARHDRLLDLEGAELYLVGAGFGPAIDVASFHLKEEAHVHGLRLRPEPGSTYDPLVRVASYNLHLQNWHVRGDGAPGDCVYFDQGQQFTVTALEAEFCGFGGDGWAIILDDVIAFDGRGVVVESSCNGLWIKGGGDPRQGRGIRTDLYAENIREVGGECGTALYLDGVDGAEIGPITGSGLIRIGGTSRRNEIKLGAFLGVVWFEPGSYFNELDWPRDRHSYIAIIDDGYQNNPEPAVFGSLIGEQALPSGYPSGGTCEMIPGNHLSALASYCHLESEQYVTSTPAPVADDTQWVQLKAGLDDNTVGWLVIQDYSGNRYDRLSKSWVPAGEALNWPLLERRAPTLNEVEITDAAGRRFIFRVSVQGGSADLHYLQMSDQSQAARP